MFWSLSLPLAESTEWHGHDVFEFVFCRSGSGLLVLDRRDFALERGRSVLIPPKVRHRFVFGPAESADLKVVCLTWADLTTHLAPAQADALRHMERAGGTCTDHSGHEPRLWELVDSIPDGLGHEDPAELNFVWALLGLLLALHARGQCLSGGGPGARHQGAVRQVCAWLDTHAAQPGDLDGIASRFGLSRSLLTREFRRHTGTSVVEYITTRRLQRAGATLASSDRSIPEVAMECGFASLPHFYQKFRALYGITPAEFRRQMTGLSAS